MKFRYEKSDDREEIIAYSKTKNELIKLIETLCYQEEHSLIGYQDGNIKELNALEIECFYTQNEKVYASIDGNAYLVKKRLYELSELLKDAFIYINQGCLANLKLVDHFEANIGGSLLVVFNSGYKDYVSRRQIKNVKERIGIKNEK